MTIMYLRSIDSSGFVDTESRKIHIGKKSFDIPPGVMLKPGDSIVVSGAEYTLCDFVPPLLEYSSDKGYQTIKTHDASYMIFNAGIRAGSHVMESGVGNGLFTAHLLWAVTLSGSVKSIDTSEKALELCKSNLRNLYSLENWSSEVGDIREYHGADVFDSVFLDIPDPWNAVSTVKKNIRSGGSLVIYSPNFNQIEKAVLEMNRNDFYVFETTEILKRNIIVREGSTRPDHRMLGHTAFIAFALKRSGFSRNIS